MDIASLSAGAHKYALETPFAEHLGSAGFLGAAQRRQGGGKPVVANVPTDLLDEILLEADVRSVAGHVDNVAAVADIDAETESLQNVLEVGAGDVDAQQSAQALAPQARASRCGKFTGNVDGAGREVATGQLDDQAGGAIERRQHAVVRRRALEPMAGVRMQVEPARGGTHRARVEPGAFQQYVAGSRRNGARGAAHDAAEG